MKRSRILFASMVLVSLAAPAFAITYGTADGKGHPNVGGLIAEGWLRPEQKDLLCSGTLIAPQVYLTAAHCTSYLESLGISKVWVTFDNQFSAKSKLHSGRMVTHPEYGSSQSDPHDIAVVLLDRAVSGITPARLPQEGLFDRLSDTHQLGQQLFTNVGYGGQERNIGPGGPTISYLDAREYSVSSFNALNSAWLRLSQNRATGNGGTCYGDSGGPQFLGAGNDESNMVVSTTITGDSQCVATNVTYRLDTASARAFLWPFVALP